MSAKRSGYAQNNRSAKKAKLEIASKVQRINTKDPVKGTSGTRDKSAIKIKIEIEDEDVEIVYPIKTEVVKKEKREERLNYFANASPPSSQTVSKYGRLTCYESVPINFMGFECQLGYLDNNVLKTVVVLTVDEDDIDMKEFKTQFHRISRSANTHILKMEYHFEREDDILFTYRYDMNDEPCQLSSMTDMGSVDKEKICSAIANGIRYLHDKDLPHNSLITNNILVYNDSVAKIINLAFIKTSKKRSAVRVSKASNLLSLVEIFTTIFLNRRTRNFLNVIEALNIKNQTIHDVLDTEFFMTPAHKMSLLKKIHLLKDDFSHRGYWLRKDNFEDGARRHFWISPQDQGHIAYDVKSKMKRHVSNVEAFIWQRINDLMFVELRKAGTISYYMDVVFAMHKQLPYRMYAGFSDRIGSEIISVEDHLFYWEDQFPGIYSLINKYFADLDIYDDE